MKKISLKNFMLMAFCLFMANGLSAQVVVDFESPGTTTVFGGFGGAAYVGAIANPDQSGINTSATVGEYFEAFLPPDPQCWAGITSANPLPSPLDFVNYSNVCVKVWAPAPGNMLMKCEAPSSGGTWEQLQTISVGGQWVEVCFDGSVADAATGSGVAHGRTFNIATLFFDFCSALPPPTGDNTWYFDDITMDGPPPPSVGLNDVTFRVNMNSYMVPFGKVSVSGTFNGWHPNIDQLSDPDGDGIYEKTIALPAGPILYKFQVDDWSGQEFFGANAPCTANNNGNWDRTYNVTGNATLPAYCYSTCTVCPDQNVPIRDVTFSVNMMNYANPYGTMFLSGQFNGWSQFANPMSDIDGDGVWQTTIQLVEGQYTEYKFQVDGWQDQEFFDPAIHGACTVTNFGFTNRFYTAGADNEVLPTYCFATCDICPAFVVPTMGEWAVFILALLMIAVGAVFMMGMENKKVLATTSGTAAVGGTMKSMPFDKGNFFKAIKHAIGLGVVGFAGIYFGWGEIVAADLLGMFVSVPIVAYIIHLFYKK